MQSAKKARSLSLGTVLPPGNVANSSSCSAAKITNGRILSRGKYTPAGKSVGQLSATREFFSQRSGRG